MSMFKTYDEFNEAHVYTHKYVSDVIAPIIKDARRRKVIKRGTDKQREWDAPAWLKSSNIYSKIGELSYDKKIDSTEIIIVGYVQNLKDDIYSIFITQDRYSIQENIQLGLLSSHPFDIKDIDDIFPETLTTTYGKTISEYTREIDDDFSDKPKNIKDTDGYHVQVFFVRYTYKEIKTDEISISHSEIIKLPEYENLLSIGVEDISSNLQKRKNTFMFAYPSDLVVPLGTNMNKTKYVQSRYAIYQSGYIRYHDGKDGNMTPVSRFNSTSIEGWKTALKKVKSLFENSHKQIEKQGRAIFFYNKDVNDEEIQKKIVDYAKNGNIPWKTAGKFLSSDFKQRYRGAIKGSTFGV